MAGRRGAENSGHQVATARISIGLTEGSRMAHSELKMLLEQYTLFMNQLDELAQNIAELLKSIPGSPNEGVVVCVQYSSGVC